MFKFLLFLYIFFAVLVIAEFVVLTTTVITMFVRRHPYAKLQKSSFTEAAMSIAKLLLFAIVPGLNALFCCVGIVQFNELCEEILAYLEDRYGLK